MIIIVVRKCNELAKNQKNIVILIHPYFIIEKDIEIKERLVVMVVMVTGTGTTVERYCIASKGVA